MPTKRTCLATLLFQFLVIGSWAGQEPNLDPLPAPVSNNAVAILHSEYGTKIFSFMGVGPKKTWDAVTTGAYQMDLARGKWEEKRTVPGVVGRLAATAVGLNQQVFIFGGYVLDGDGKETTLPDVNVFVPGENRYYSGKDVPVPVDDAVAGIYSQRYIFLIGGRSNDKAVRNVQVYDTDKNEWTQATPTPGTPVFGHAGAIAGDTIVYVDGAYKNPETMGAKYLPSNECWIGKIPNKDDVTKIEWTKLPAHPGNAHYRIAAGVVPDTKKGGKIYFSGGTDNPYNYNGVGYNGKAAEPSPVTFAFDVRTGTWETIHDNTPDPVMDSRGLLVTHRGLLVIGGMEKGQQVTAKVTIVKAEARK
jgi:N-acetylneuraminic acid mutarotase